jgi:hypothetical protein
MRASAGSLLDHRCLDVWAATAAGISNVRNQPYECGASVERWRDRVNYPKDIGPVNARGAE